jgi:hypothetical protein
MQCGGEVVSMAEQVGNFTRLVRTWERQKRRRQAAEAARLVSRSLVFISVGSNDLFEYSDFFADPRNRNASRNDAAFLQGLVAFYAAYVKVRYGTVHIYSPSICNEMEAYNLLGSRTRFRTCTPPGQPSSAS